MLLGMPNHSHTCLDFLKMPFCHLRDEVRLKIIKVKYPFFPEGRGVLSSTSFSKALLFFCCYFFQADQVLQKGNGGPVIMFACIFACL